MLPESNQIAESILLCLKVFWLTELTAFDLQYKKTLTFSSLIFFLSFPKIKPILWPKQASFEDYVPLTNMFFWHSKLILWHLVNEKQPAASLYSLVRQNCKLWIHLGEPHSLCGNTVGRVIVGQSEYCGFGSSFLLSHVSVSLGRALKGGILWKKNHFSSDLGCYCVSQVHISKVKKKKHP